MKKFFFILSIISILSCTVCADETLTLEAFEPHCLIVPETVGIPDWGDAAWNKAASINEFYQSPGRSSAFPVSVKLLYRGTDLFIKAELGGETESGIPAGPAEPAKCEFLWKDSCLNFYIDPGKSNKNAYCHFINSAGVTFQFGKNVSKGWHGDWLARTQLDKNKGEWKVLARCGLEAMDGTKPGPGAVWGINFNRHIGSLDGRILEMSGWPLNHYKPSSMYATLIFGPGAKEEIRLNQVSLIKKGEDSFALQFKAFPKNPDNDAICAQIRISSRNTPAITVFSGSAVFSKDNICNIPFRWNRVKDGYHLIDIILRDAKGLVAGIADFTFHLSSPAEINTGKPLIWPEPRIWKPSKGFWIMPARINLYTDEKTDRFPALLLKSELEKRYGVKVKLFTDKRVFESTEDSITLDYTKTEQGKREEFTLEIKPDSVRLKAAGPKFMYYAVRAFIDMLRQSTGNNFQARAECGECTDWPGVERRAFMFYPEMGLTYKTKPSVESLKKLIYEQVAGGRYDMLILVIKGAMKYDSHPELLNNPAYLGKYYTKAEIKELIAYARRHYLEVIPGGDSPGHSEWLGVPCPDLREDGGDPETVCTRNPKTMKILEDTYSELLELFAPCDCLFISGGEVFYSTALTPPEKRCRLCRDADKVALLLEHWKKLNEFCGKRKVRPVIWSDMISRDWNGGGRWNTAGILNDVPRNITVTSWDPADNRAIQPEEIVKMGFPKPWRITTVFAEQQVDAFLKNYKHYEVEGIAEDYPWLWCNFQADSVETSCSYTSPAIHIFADCAWNPETAGEDYFRHIESRGPYWVRLMNVPEWGLRKLDWKPLPFSQACNMKDRNLPEGELSIGGIPFDLGKSAFNVISVSGKGNESKAVTVMMKVTGLAFMHNMTGTIDVQRKLQRFFKEENTCRYGIKTAFIKIIYADGKEVLEPIILGWNTHFSDCYPPARVMPGADFYWTRTGTEAKKRKDICYWTTAWKNPYPDIAVKEIKLVANSDATVILSGISAALKPIQWP